MKGKETREIICLPVVVLMGINLQFIPEITEL